MAKALIIDKKDQIILRILKDNPHGLKADTILKLSNFRSRTLYNHFKKLKELKILENIYPIWRLCQNQISSSKMAKLLKSDKDIQSHKFSVHLRLIRKPEWWNKRSNRLMKLKQFNFKIGKEVTWGNNPYEQILTDNFLIHLFPDAIYFINRKQYYNSDPYLALEEALKDTLDMINFLEEKFRFKFFLNEAEQLSIKTQHYVKLDDEIAKSCKKNNYKLQIKINDKLRIWVDMSQPFGLEAGNKDHSPEDLNRYKPFVVDIIENDHLLPSQLTELSKQNTIQIGKVAENEKAMQQNMILYAKNIKSHIKAIQDVGKASKKNNKIMEKVVDLLEELKK